MDPLSKRKVNFQQATKSDQTEDKIKKDDSLTKKDDYLIPENRNQRHTSEPLEK